MRFYKKTACRVFLVGSLQAVPDLKLDEQGECVAAIQVKRIFSNDIASSYSVVVMGEAALRLRQFGFVGLHLWIEGDFQNTGKIFADRVSFVNFSESGEMDYACVDDTHYQLFYREDLQLSFIENTDRYAEKTATIH